MLIHGLGHVKFTPKKLRPLQVEDTELVAHSAQGEEVSIRVIVTVAPGTDIRPQGSDVSTGRE